MLNVWMILCYKFCLLVWDLSSHSRIFHSYGDVTVVGEGLQILTYARHSWPLSSEGSLGPVTLPPVAERLAVELSLPVLRLWSVAAGIPTPNLPLAGPTL